MAFWPFNRNKNRSTPLVGTTTELYEGENRERIGVAWLIALLSLFVTVAILMGAYLGGRWAYRKIVNKDSATKPTTSQEESKPKDEVDKDTAKDTGSTAGSNTSGTTPQSSSTSTTTPQIATPSDNNLPNTGPESDE